MRFAMIMRWMMGVMVLAAVGACGKDAVPGAVGGSGGGGANGVLAAQTWSMGQAVALSRVTNQDRIFPSLSLETSASPSPLIFAEVVDGEKSTPVILAKGADGWRVLEVRLAGEGTSRQWVSAAAVDERHEAFAFVDDAGDGSASQLVVLHTTDGGQTWGTLAGVKKVSNDATFDTFYMAKSGEGRLMMYLDDDVDGHPRGCYFYATKDGGVTWSGPEVVADDTDNADVIDEGTSLAEQLKAVDEATTAPAVEAAPAGAGK